MMLLRLLLVTICTSAGLVLLTQVPAAACSCVAADTAEHVAGADVVFSGVLTDVEQTEPGGDAQQSSLDPVLYTFDVEETFKGDAGDAVVESARFGASCGLEGMKLDQTYVVFAAEAKDGDLEASLCGGTAVASEKLLAQVEAALDPSSQPPAPPATGVPTPPPTVPTEVPSGLATSSGEGPAAWAWFGSGVLLALVGGGTWLRLTWR